MRRGKYPRPPFGGAAITTRKAKTVSDERRNKYHRAVDEAIVSRRVDRVMAVADAEQSELRAEIERLRDSERLAWAVHREHVDRMNPMLLRERSLRDEARRERDALRAQVEAVRAVMLEHEPCRDQGGYLKSGCGLLKDLRRIRLSPRVRPEVTPPAEQRACCELHDPAHQP